MSVIFSVGVPIPGEGMGNHAYYLVQGLERYHLLKQAYVMQYHGAEIAAEKINTAYLTERIAYRLARYTHLDKYVLRDNLFDLWVSRQLKDAAIFYGWTHHALWSLKRAKRLGMVTILERANAHPITYNRLLADEYKMLGIAASPYHPLIFKKHLKELEYADYIAVTSQFTRQSLLENNIDDRRILLTPLGVDTSHFARHSEQADDIFRVVYVGQLCVRKGIHYLLKAWDRLGLKNAELILVGDLVSEMKEIVEAACQNNSTIRLLPHTSSPENVYQQTSVSILPTLEDGFGLVILEAMACGVPVIVTEHAGVKDCVRPELDGLIIPPGNADSIADTLNYCYRHRDRLQAMGRAARQRAEQFSWTRYQNGIVNHITRIAP